MGLGHLRKLEVGDKVEEIRAQLERMATGGQQGDQQVTTATDQTSNILMFSQISGLHAILHLAYRHCAQQAKVHYEERSTMKKTLQHSTWSMCRGFGFHLFTGMC